MSSRVVLELLPVGVIASMQLRQQILVSTFQSISFSFKRLEISGNNTLLERPFKQTAGEPKLVEPCKDLNLGYFR